jgi:hypothetical protein
MKISCYFSAGGMLLASLIPICCRNGWAGGNSRANRIFKMEHHRCPEKTRPRRWMETMVQCIFVNLGRLLSPLHLPFAEEGDHGYY